MPILALVVIALQIFIAVHVCRSGQPRYWVFVVLCFPVIGTLIYFIVEVLPTLQASPKVARLDDHLARRAKMARHANAVTAAEMVDRAVNTGTVHTKLVTADKCLELGRFPEAIRLYESAREGFFVNAADLLIGLARARFGNGDYADTRQVLRDLATAHPNSFTQERTILDARTTAAMGDLPAAIADLGALLERKDSLEARRLEARYFFAELLWKQGAKDQALGELAQVIQHGKLFNMTEEEAHWVRRASEVQAAIA